MKKAYLLFVAITLLGCHHGPSPASVKVGMTREEVVAALGPGLTTGTKLDGIHNHHWERLSFKSGTDGLVVELDDDKVSKSYIVPNKTPEMARKIHQGMTDSEVISALGEPMGGRNKMQPQAAQFWVYGDAAAPVQTLMVHFENGKVARFEVTDNGAYNGQTIPSSVPTG
ncbi:MAG TPA: hypothetical protein VG820_06590 [Fimbriimonadaceae bacterium]|nr:hypothetical protein [Fimbriimonadaceae bacterium]